MTPVSMATQLLIKLKRTLSRSSGRHKFVPVAESTHASVHEHTTKKEILIDQAGKRPTALQCGVQLFDSIPSPHSGPMSGRSNVIRKTLLKDADVRTRVRGQQSTDSSNINCLPSNAAEDVGKVQEIQSIESSVMKLRDCGSISGSVSSYKRSLAVSTHTSRSTSSLVRPRDSIREQPCVKDEVAQHIINQACAISTAQISDDRPDRENPTHLLGSRLQLHDKDELPRPEHSQSLPNDQIDQSMPFDMANAKMLEQVSSDSSDNLDQDAALRNTELIYSNLDLTQPTQASTSVTTVAGQESPDHIEESLCVTARRRPDRIASAMLRDHTLNDWSSDISDGGIFHELHLTADEFFSMDNFAQGQSPIQVVSCRDTGRSVLGELYAFEHQNKRQQQPTSRLRMRSSEGREVSYSPLNADSNLVNSANRFEKENKRQGRSSVKHPMIAKLGSHHGTSKNVRTRIQSFEDKIYENKFRASGKSSTRSAMTSI